MDSNEIAQLRSVSASMGIMLESSSERLCEKGMPHYGSVTSSQNDGCIPLSWLGSPRCHLHQAF